MFKLVIVTLLLVSIEALDPGFLREWKNYIQDYNDWTISIIGWQNVYDDEGNIVEVDSLELAFPRNNIFDKVDKISSRSEVHGIIKELKPLEGLSQFGLALDVTAESKDVLFYWNPNTTFLRFDGLATYKRTVVTTQEQIDALLSTFDTSEYLLPLQTYIDDVNGTRKDNQSLVLPSIFVNVAEFSSAASPNIILDGPKYLVDAVVTYKRSKIPEVLAKKFDEEFPEYEWRVLSNPGKFRVANDVWIRLSFDTFSFYNLKLEYLVYGLSKNTTI